MFYQGGMPHSGDKDIESYKNLAQTTMSPELENALAQGKIPPPSEFAQRCAAAKKRQKKTRKR